MEARVVYIHGNGNKVRAELLKSQWDRALFGVDMGDASHMAYWAPLRYPAPLPDTRPDPLDGALGPAEESVAPALESGEEFVARTLAAARAEAAQDISRGAAEAGDAGGGEAGGTGEELSLIHRRPGWRRCRCPTSPAPRSCACWSSTPSRTSTRTSSAVPGRPSGTWSGAPSTPAGTRRAVRSSSSATASAASPRTRCCARSGATWNSS